MLLRDVMTPNVEYISPDTTLSEAATKMRDLDVGALPIGENDKLVGMLTDRDITVRGVAEGKDPKQVSVRDAMTENVVYCYDDEDLSAASKTMREKQIRRVIVLNRDKRMVGICSLGDLVVDSGDETLGGKVLQDVSKPTK
ncbi:CBS domain-containing protein [candidate division GN15 bacterium]|nr:CBS domain-containing protein [candidate division GN15 bacterium]